MTQSTRCVGVALISAVVAFAAAPVCADDRQEEAVHHVRSGDASIVALITLARQQSTTFRGLIDTIDASEGVVYVESGPCTRGVSACLVSVTKDGGHRFVWVHVEARGADWNVMGSIGHELRHVIEVLSNPTVTSTAALRSFYLHLGATAGFLKPFETEAAVAAGAAVRAEVQNYRRGKSTTR